MEHGPPPVRPQIQSTGMANGPTPFQVSTSRFPECHTDNTAWLVWYQNQLSHGY